MSVIDALLSLSTVLIPLLLILGVYRLGTTPRNKACDGIVDDIDVGGVGTIEIWTTAPPANVADARTGTKLGTLTFSATAFGAAATGAATAAAITSDTNADASGTALGFLIKTGGAVNHSDGSCGLGSGDLNFDNNVIVAGGVIAISSMTVTVPIS